MAQNYIQIFDDNVVKLSIKQGTEAQRVSDTLGTFTIAEPAYTRDTGRLFIGDFDNSSGFMETIGGSLVGNKYLGMVDSRPPETTWIDSEEPLSYTEQTIKSGITEEPILTETSKFRVTNSDSTSWSRQATYNNTYDAYNGDLIYDKYQNALILFDNKIKPINSQEVTFNPNDPTPFVNYISPTADNSSNQHVDSFGDGYVVFKNIVPDNRTCRFKPKKFLSDGIAEGSNNNYNNNILEVISVPTSSLSENFSDNFVSGEINIDLNTHLKRINSIIPTSNVLSIGESKTYIKTGNSAISFSGDFSNRNDKDKFALTLEPNGTSIYVNSAGEEEEIQLYNTALLNVSSLIPVSGTNSSVESETNTISTKLKVLNEPIFLAWTVSNYEYLNPLLQSTTSAHLSAALEFKVDNTNIYCNRKYVYSPKLPAWGGNIPFLNDPQSYFNATDFNVNSEPFHIWNSGLLARGNNSFASLALAEIGESNVLTVNNQPNLGDTYNYELSSQQSALVQYYWADKDFTVNDTSIILSWKEAIEGPEDVGGASTFNILYKEITPGSFEYYIPEFELIRYSDGTEIYSRKSLKKLKSLKIDNTYIYNNEIITLSELENITNYSFTKVIPSSEETNPPTNPELLGLYEGYALLSNASFYNYNFIGTPENPFYNYITYDTVENDGSSKQTTLEIGNTKKITKSIKIYCRDVKTLDGITSEYETEFIKTEDDRYRYYILDDTTDISDINISTEFLLSLGQLNENNTVTPLYDVSSLVKQDSSITYLKITDSPDIGSLSISSNSKGLEINTKEISQEYDINGNISYETYLRSFYYQKCVVNYEKGSQSDIKPSNITYNGITYNEEINDSVFIPTDLHEATSLLISVEKKYESEEDIAIFTAKDFSNLRLPDLYSGNFVDNNYKDTRSSFISEGAESSSTVFKVISPAIASEEYKGTFIDGHGSTYLNDKNEIKLESYVFELPVNDGTINLRMGNINFPTVSNKDTLSIKLIGYRVNEL